MANNHPTVQATIVAALAYPAVPRTVKLLLSRSHSMVSFTDEDKSGGFVSRWGKRIRAAGGNHTSARGYQYSHRYVTLPMSEDGMALAASLIDADWDKARGLGVRFEGIAVYHRRDGYERLEAKWEYFRKEIEISVVARTWEEAVAKLGEEIAKLAAAGTIAPVDRIAECEAVGAARKEAQAKREAEAAAAERKRDAAEDMYDALTRAAARMESVAGEIAMVPEAASYAESLRAMAILARAALTKADGEG